MQPRGLVLALQARDQLGQRALIGHLADNPEQRGLLVGLQGVGGLQQFAHAHARALGVDDLYQGRLVGVGLGQFIQQQLWREAAGTRQRGNHARDGPAAALGQRLHEHGEILGVGHRREYVHAGQGDVLVGVRKRGQQWLDG